MWRLMMRYFHNKATVYFSLLCPLFLWMTGCSSVAPVVKRMADTRLTNFVVWTEDLRSDELKNSYRIVLKTPDNGITGLCLLQKKGNEWRGTFMNEMMAKAFDFIITDEKCELLNVISLMDKWYIKKTIAADLHFLFNADNPKASFQKRLERFEQQGTKVVNYRKKQLTVMPDGAVRMTNKRRNLQYELRKMIEIDSDKVIL